MAIQIIDYGTSDYDKMVLLRYQVLRKPLNLEFEENELDNDKKDTLIGCFENDKIMGCCILTKMDKGTMRLRQMAVHSGLQGKGVGRAILLFSENLARDFGYKKMIMHARADAVGFYKKLGYNTFDNEFIEVTLPHFMMEKKLNR
ncbi:MAG TPA: GNAT family N-acetyltransferase [Arachidicoccus soli]|uniref:GNAT family N-acetyltransferase n=1 Tax=Arachidicoccus soli TaxID=2341117 RepID=A0A386HTB9_9BACT|nr:GNAT family N-acetyltransferase [Arachidicoccus soli]AYD49125.1 GNAT family N-acetyltransferase [Arachidicoccus soli]HEU0227819.1 GNAT family N-acetyltransferase [Arachidicoccus soli]